MNGSRRTSAVVCVPNPTLFGQVIQRSNDAGRPGGSGNKFAYEVYPYTPMVRWFAAPLGVQNALAAATLLTDPDTVFAARKMPPVPLDGWRAKLAGVPGAGRQGTSLAAGRRGNVPAYDSFDPATTTDFRGHFGAGRIPQRHDGQTWLPINRGLISPGELRIRAPRWVTVCIICHAPARPGCSCRNTGM